MASPITIPTIPYGNPAPTVIDACLKSLQTWSEQTSERLLELDTKLSGFPNIDKADHSLAFILWKAVDNVVKVTAETPSTWKPDPSAQSVHIAFLERPVLGTDGAKLANSTAEAMKILGALLSSVERECDAQQQTTLMGASINDNLALAAPLVKALDMRAAEYADLTEAAAAISPDTPPATIQNLANRAIRLHADLKEASAEREHLLVAYRRDAELVAELRELEARAAAVVIEAREKITNPPKFGLLSVDALGDAPTITDLETTPWPSVRSQLHERSTKLARAKASLEHVEKANVDVLRERHQLRQLVDAYRAKAMGARIGEVPVIGDAYAEARSVLWTAPCDLVRGREAALTYQRVVLDEIARRGGPSPAPGTTGSGTTGSGTTGSGTTGTGTTGSGTTGTASPGKSAPLPGTFPDLLPGPNQGANPKRTQSSFPNPFDTGNRGHS